jgi:uncharacterized protein
MTTLLHHAAQKGERHLVETLLKKHPADAKALDSFKRLPLFVSLLIPPQHEKSLEMEKKAIFKMLWKHAPDTLCHQDYTGETVFHLLTHRGYEDLLTEILNAEQQGAFIANHNGLYPIHTAILSDQLPCVEVLCELPKVMEQTDNEGRTPLHYAAHSGSPKIVELCCEKAHNLNVCDTEQKTPYMLAKEANNTAAMKILSRHGADIS